VQPTAAASLIAAVPPTDLPPPTEPAPTDLPVTEAAVVPTLEPTPVGPATEAAPTESAEVPTEIPPPTATEAAGGIPAPGQGDVIAFASDRTGTAQIWLLVVTNGELVQLTQQPEGACQPAWSPDGAQLVFVSPCPGNQESYPGSALYLINADGTDETQLTDGAAGDYDPDWSVTNLIAFTSLRDFSTQIFVLDPSSGGAPVALTRSSPNRDPSWSPDGTSIAFVTTRLGPQQIFTMTAFGEIAAAGSRARQFTRDDKIAYSNPRWSPDGDLLIYNIAPPAGGVPDIVGSKVSDIGLKEFTLYDAPGKGPLQEPDFSPDSQWVVAEGWPQGINHDLFRISIDGLDRENLTSDPALDFDPAWRP
jgi:Tol biopolymer transport system component